MFNRIITELSNTGERPMIGKYFEEINPVLRFAYQQAVPYIKHKSVLDFGCGGGYGTEYLSRFTNKDVLGYDIDIKTIKINKQFFVRNKNLKFTHNKHELEMYDVITSFQVIEHLNEKSIPSYLVDIKEHLTNEGLFICSTVNKLITSNGLKKPIFPFHNYEFTPDELKNMLNRYFTTVTLYGQIAEKALDMDKNNIAVFNRQSIRTKILRDISQYELIRFAARRTPLFVKNCLTFSKEEDSKETYRLVQDQLVNYSYILIAICK